MHTARLGFAAHCVLAAVLSGYGAEPVAQTAPTVSKAAPSGAVTHCDVESGGITVRRTVTVNHIDGLMMEFDLLPT